MKPNVLLICTDHWSGKMLGCNEHQHILTPTLNQLAANGTLFNQAYSTCPTCIPARRSIMTGTSPETHGDRIFKEHEKMPKNLITMPQVFRDNGYQAFAVGKLHVYPQRNRIGFDDVISCEEGRHHLGGGLDDFELYLKDRGFAGQELTHAMGNNHYTVRPWHLPEDCHPTNWTTKQMCRMIQRRDRQKPAFWFCSYIAPHPPITPITEYLDMYRNCGVDKPFCGDWAKDFDQLPYALKSRYDKFQTYTAEETRLARMGFYAQCTYIDHQIRLLIGTLDEEGLLDNTIIMFTSDHGDMLGNHNLWSKPPMYEWSSKIPMILVPQASAYDRCPHHNVDERFVVQEDIMPTLLDLCDIKIPESVEGISMIGEGCRDYIYSEHYECDLATRMIRKGDYKLIWYPVGNIFQLFNLRKDPDEMNDISKTDTENLEDIKKILADELYGSDMKWLKDGLLIGEPDKKYIPGTSRNLAGQRGWR